MEKLLRLLTFSIVAISTSSQAIDSVDVLPKNIISPSIKQGFISSLDQQFTSKGTLISLSDTTAVELDLGALKEIDPEVSRLESALNQFGSNNLGSDLHLGVLKVQTHPEVSYTAPVIGYGVSESLTIGLGLPVINYKNEMQFTHSGSNVQTLREQLYGLSAELDNAFDLLSADVAKEAQQTLVSKGYKPIKSRDETLLGDIQLASLWQLHKDSTWGLQLKSTLTLPTGPKDNADDLTDIPGFGQTAIENQIITNHYVFPWLMLSGRGGYRWAIKDRVEKRVPLNAQDTLPDADQKTTVDRDLGDSFSACGAATITLKNGFSIGGGIEAGTKLKDEYSGSIEGDYSALSEDTSSQWKKSIYEISYSSVQSYFAKRSLIPAIFTLNFSDIIAGKNIERQTTTEFNATLFF